MNLLFIQGGSRLKQSEDGRWWTDPNFTSEIWERYLSLCDHLSVLLRKEERIYSIEEVSSRFNAIPDDERLSVVPLDDIVVPKFNIINPIVRKRIISTIDYEIRKADKVIIRSCSFYCIECYKLCMKYNKPYLYEVTGFIYEGIYNHSFLGKLSASYFERWSKKIAQSSEGAIYVTNEALQRRYPAPKMLGCSDVELLPTTTDVLESRLKKIANRKQGDVLKIGTAAFLDVKWKGQSLVLRALFELKKRGVDSVHYELVGMGSGNELKKLVREYGLDDQVLFVGPMPHNEIFDWLDSIDVYVQPSYQEGLCRIIAEALSRACPVICSNVGGNYELVSSDYLFPCGDYKSLSEKIQEIIPNMKAQACINFEHSKDYDKSVIDERRRVFFKSFIEF